MVSGWAWKQASLDLKQASKPKRAKLNIYEHKLLLCMVLSVTF